MSELLDLQRRVAAVVMQPLTREEGMRRSLAPEADELVKPNSRLSSFERLEIYNRQYWFRVLSCFAEDFPGLRAIVGGKRFEALSRAYLLDCPSVSFTLRNLGSQLERWLTENPKWIVGMERLALDMVRLEWAHIEAFDAAAEAPITPEQIEASGMELRVRLQPYIRLLELSFPVEDLLIEARQYEGDAGSSNAARIGRLRRRVKAAVLPKPEQIYLAVHRFEDTIYYKRLEREAFQMLRAFEAGRSLEEAIERAFDASDMPDDERISNLQTWFGAWSVMGWLCAL